MGPYGLERNLFTFSIPLLCVSDKEAALPSLLHVETEHEREVTQQLKQTNDTIARLQDQLRDAADRERQLQKQLVDARNGITRLLREKEMKVRYSKI